MTTELSKQQAGEMEPARAMNYLKPYYEVEPEENRYSVRVFMPGVDQKGTEIVHEDDCLKITGTRTWKAPEDWRALHREIRSEDCRLVLQLGGEIDPGKIEAKMEDGVLELKLHKRETVKPRKIRIA